MKRRTFLGSVTGAIGGLLAWRPSVLFGDKPKRNTAHIVRMQMPSSGPCPCCCEESFQMTALVPIEYTVTGDSSGGSISNVKRSGLVRMIYEPCGCDISSVLGSMGAMKDET